jgi:CubicO group peptidase (beta-lactamase class C family)
VHIEARAAGLVRIHAAMAAHVENNELPGIVTLVARGDDVRVDAIGVTAFGNDRPMRRETPFRIASMTKPVLAAATMLLVEEDVLKLDEPVERWLPELANRRVLRRFDGPLEDTLLAHRAITLDDLLTFRMGHGLVFDPMPDPPIPIVKAATDLQLVLGEPDPRTPHPPDEWMRRFGSLPLMYQPGERWQYNVGSLVLGVLVARAAGQPLGDFFNSRIFEPLGMRHTGFWLPVEITRELPSYYTTNFGTGQLERRDVSTPDEWSQPPAFPSGAGGLLSTVDDYLAFARMLLNKGSAPAGKRLLSERSVELMTTNHLTPEQIANGGPALGGRGWGYGMGVVTEPDAEWPVPGRYGWAGGYGTTWFNDPYTGTIAMAMTQVSDVLWNGTLDEFDKLVGAYANTA